MSYRADPGIRAPAGLYIDIWAGPGFGIFDSLPLATWFQYQIFFPPPPLSIYAIIPFTDDAIGTIGPREWGLQPTI